VLVRTCVCACHEKEGVCGDVRRRFGFPTAHQTPIMHSPRRSPRKVPYRKLATNPLRDDARLRTLLSSLDENVQCASDWDIWVEAFLTRWISFLDETGTAAAEASYQDFGTTLTDLIRVINKLNLLVEQGVFASPETVTVKARQCTSEFSRAFEVVVQDLDDLIPMTIAHETKVHYSKFHLGAVLIRDGFAEYGRMSLAADACERLALLLNDVVDKSVLLNMKYYTLKLQAFCDVMADLGLLPAMLKCREFVHHTSTTGSSNNSPSNDPSNKEAANKDEALEEEEDDVAMSALAQTLSITHTPPVLMLENKTPLPDQEETTTPVVVEEDDWRINQIVEYPSLFVEAARLDTGASRSNGNGSVSPSQDQGNTLQLVPVYNAGNTTALLAWSYPDFLVATGHNDELVVYQRRDLVPLGQRNGVGSDTDMTRSVSLWQREPASYSSHGNDETHNNDSGSSRLERDPAPYSSCPSLKESILRSATPTSPVSSSKVRLERDPAPYSSVAFLADKDQVQVERDPALYSLSNVAQSSKPRERESAPYSSAAAPPTQRSSGNDATLERDPAPYGMASSTSNKDSAKTKAERDPAPYGMSSSKPNKDSAKLERDPAPYGMSSSKPNKKDSAKTKAERDTAPYGMASSTSNKDSTKVKPERDPAPYSSSNGSDKSGPHVDQERESTPYSSAAPCKDSTQTKVEREPAPYAKASKKKDASNRSSERDPAPYSSSNLNDQTKNSGTSGRESAPYSKAAPAKDSAAATNLEREPSPYAVATSKEQDSTKDKLGRDPAPYSLSTDNSAGAAKEKLEREPAPYAMASSKEKNDAKLKQDREPAPYSSGNEKKRATSKKNSEREPALYSLANEKDQAKGKDTSRSKAKVATTPNAPVALSRNSKEVDSSKNLKREPAPYSSVASLGDEPASYSVTSAGDGKELDSSTVKLERDPAPYALSSNKNADKTQSNLKREPAPYSMAKTGDKENKNGDRDPAPYSSVAPSATGKPSSSRDAAPYSTSSSSPVKKDDGETAKSGREPAPYSSTPSRKTIKKSRQSPQASNCDGSSSSGSDSYDENGVRKLSDREAAPYSSGPPEDASSNFCHDREPAPYAQGPQKSVGRVRWDPKKFYKGPPTTEKVEGSPVKSKSDSGEVSNRKGLLSRNKSKEKEVTSAPSGKPSTKGEQERKPRRRLKQSLEELYNRARYRISKTLDKTRQQRQPKDKASSQKMKGDEAILHDHDIRNTDDQDSVESESDSDRLLMLPPSTDLDDVSESTTAQSDDEAPVAEVRELEKQAGNKRRVAQNRDVLALENQKPTHGNSAPRQLLAIEDRTTDFGDEDTLDSAPQKLILAIEDQKPTIIDEILAIECDTGDQNEKGSSEIDSGPVALDPCSHKSLLTVPTLTDDVSESSTVHSATYVPVHEVQPRASSNEGATKTTNTSLQSIEPAAMVELSTPPASSLPSIVSSDEKSVDIEEPEEAISPLVDPVEDSADRKKVSPKSKTAAGAKKKKPKKKATKDHEPQSVVSLPDKEESQPSSSSKNTSISSVSNEQEKEKNGSISVPDSTAKADIVDKPAKAATVQTKKAPAVVDDELRRKCYMWYARMGQPTRDVMKRRVAKMDKTCDITPDDVDALPWICSGQMISASAMSKLILSLDAK
jgi:hypothetical protein